MRLKQAENRCSIQSLQDSPIDQHRLHDGVFVVDFNHFELVRCDELEGLHDAFLPLRVLLCQDEDIGNGRQLDRLELNNSRIESMVKGLLDVAALKDLNAREFVILSILAVAVLFFGLGFLLAFVESPTQKPALVRQ